MCSFPKHYLSPKALPPSSDQYKAVILTKVNHFHCSKIPLKSNLFLIFQQMFSERHISVHHLPSLSL